MDPLQGYALDPHVALNDPRPLAETVCAYSSQLFWLRPCSYSIVSITVSVEHNQPEQHGPLLGQTNTLKW